MHLKAYCMGEERERREMGGERREKKRRLVLFTLLMSSLTFRQPSPPTWISQQDFDTILTHLFNLYKV